MVKKKSRQIIDTTKASTGIAPLADQYSHLFVSAFLFLALILRIIALADLKGSIYYDFLLWDERIYHEWARKIADGTFTSTSVYEFPPLPAYITALIYKLISPDAFYVRVMNIIFGVLTCWLIYLIGKELANRTIGLASCLIACFYKPFIFYSIVPLKTSLEVFLFALTAWLFVSVLNNTLSNSSLEEKGGVNKKLLMKVGILGLSAGLLLNVRPNAILIIPVMPLIILWNFYRDRNSQKLLIVSLAIYIAGLAVALSPFMIRNYREAGEFTLTTSQAGFNLYLGNNLRNPDPYYRPVPFASSSPFEQGVQFIIEASRRVGERLSPKETSNYWMGEVVATAIEQPAAFIRKLLLKTLVLFNQFEACDHYDIPFISNVVAFFKLPFFSFWCILPFGMAGIASAFGNRKARALSAVFALYGLTLIVFFTNARYRMPLLVILIPFAVMGINSIISFYKTLQFQKAGIIGSIILLCFFVEFLPVQATDDVTAYYNTHALILDAKGFEKEAFPYWMRSSGMNKPFSAYANLAIAEKYYSKGHIQKGNVYLDKIPDDSFAAAAKYELLGDLLLYLRQREKAIQAYERSLEINSGQRIPRMKLIDIYKAIDNKKALQEEEKLKYISSFYDFM